MPFNTSLTFPQCNHVACPSGGVNTVLNFGVQFVAYSTFQLIGSELIAGDNASAPESLYYRKQNVATDNSGNYAVAFVRNGSAGNEQVNLRLFNSDNSPRGSEIVVTPNAVSFNHLVEASSLRSNKEFKDPKEYLTKLE